MFSPLPAFVRSFVLSKIHFFEIEILFELFFATALNRSIDRSVRTELKNLKINFEIKKLWVSRGTTTISQVMSGAAKRPQTQSEREREKNERERETEREEWESGKSDNMRVRERERVRLEDTTRTLVWSEKEVRAFMSEKGRERGKDRKRAPRLCSKREREREQMCDWSATGQSDGTKRNKNANSKYLNRVFNQFYLPSNCLVRRFNKSVELNYTNPLKIYVFNLFVQNRTVKNKSIFASLGLCSAHLSLYLVTHPPIRAHFLEKTTNVKQERERERETKRRRVRIYTGAICDRKKRHTKWKRHSSLKTFEDIH